MPLNAHVKPHSYMIQNPPLSPSVTATITVGENLSLATNQTSPVGWAITNDGLTITLDPASSQQLPVWYQFTVQAASGSGRSLVGVSLFSVSESDSAIFFPALSGSVILNLLNNLTTGSGTFSYHMELYLHDDAQSSFAPPVIEDPTITFEPQGGGSSLP